MCKPDYPKRKGIRLKGFDYSSNGMYFITICTDNRKNLFGKIENNAMGLNVYGAIVEHNLKIAANLYEGVSIVKYVIMPNHIHLIISICRAYISCMPIENRTKMMVPKMIQSLKSSVTKDIRAMEKQHAYNACPTIWQSRYHDHIIRNEKEYLKIWEYIDTNPLQWEIDRFYNDVL